MQSGMIRLGRLSAMRNEFGGHVEKAAAGAR
jgi:hypothetical protein